MEWLIFWAVVIVATFLWIVVGYPIWNVWASKKEADAKLYAAETNKQAEIIEASAEAEKIALIGDKETYVRLQWIKMMEERTGETIYVPTEANLPIMEAGKQES